MEATIDGCLREKLQKLQRCVENVLERCLKNGQHIVEPKLLRVN